MEKAKEKSRLIGLVLLTMKASALEYMISILRYMKENSLY